MQILWSNYFLVGNACWLAWSQNCNFLKIAISFFETNEPEAVIFTSRLIFFEDLCRNEKNAACCFLVCRPDCVGVIIPLVYCVCWRWAPISAELYVLRIWYLHAWKNRTTFNTTYNILQNAEDGVFCFIVEVHVWCEAQAVVIFQERNVPTFVKPSSKISLGIRKWIEAFHSMKKMRNSID